MPVYYDDYGYDEYYDDYYDAYYDYYEEEEEVKETVPALAEGLTDKDLISKLWLDFIKERFHYLLFLHFFNAYFTILMITRLNPYFLVYMKATFHS